MTYSSHNGVVTLMQFVLTYYHLILIHMLLHRLRYRYRCPCTSGMTKKVNHALALPVESCPYKELTYRNSVQPLNMYSSFTCNIHQTSWYFHFCMNISAFWGGLRRLNPTVSTHTPDVPGLHYQWMDEWPGDCGCCDQSRGPYSSSWNQPFPGGGWDEGLSEGAQAGENWPESSGTHSHTGTSTRFDHTGATVVQV